MEKRLEKFQKNELSKMDLSQIKGGQAGYYAIVNGKLVWVDSKPPVRQS